MVRPAHPGMRLPLRSILALAGGAVVLPLQEAAEGAIHATTFATPIAVGFGSGQVASYAIGLPGSTSAVPVELKFQTLLSNTYGPNYGRAAIQVIGSGPSCKVGLQSSNRSVAAGSVAGASVAFRALAGQTWNNSARQGSGAANIVKSSVRRSTIASDPLSYAPVTYLQGPGGFNDKYLLFKFTNQDLTGDPTNYGWVKLSATRTGGDRTGMSVTLTAWAYQDDGSKIAAGAVPVPEPATDAALAIGGALVAGAAGLRRWRRRRAAEAVTASGDPTDD